MVGLNVWVFICGKSVRLCGFADFFCVVFGYFRDSVRVGL